MINLIIHGHTGKLGKKIIENIKNNVNINYFGSIDSRDKYYDYSTLKNITNLVIVDVSIDIGCKRLLEILLDKGIHVPLIIGTTGDLPIRLIEIYSAYVAVATISNFSDGITSILNILPAIRISNANIKIFEEHHIHKRDSPSGTAKTLANKIYLDHSKIFSSREGEIYGIHEIIYETEYEKIIIKHEVKDPNIFAIGCLKWVEKIVTLPIDNYKN